MGLQVFALCRETQLELEIGDLRKDLTAEYTICLEDITFTMLPALLICSILPFTQSIWSLSLSSPDRYRRICAWTLSLIPVCELVMLAEQHKAHTATFIYALAETIAWGLASAYDAGKTTERNVSWVWKSLWLLLSFADLLKLSTRVVISIIDSFWSFTLGLHIVKTALALGVVYAWLPTCRHTGEPAEGGRGVDAGTEVGGKMKWVVTLVLFNSHCRPTHCRCKLHRCRSGLFSERTRWLSWCLLLGSVCYRRSGGGSD